jgi:hypothetical protein
MSVPNDPLAPKTRTVHGSRVSRSLDTRAAKKTLIIGHPDQNQHATQEPLS